MGTISVMSSSSNVIYITFYLYFRILSISSTNESDIIFGTIFVVIWLGASILTLNAKLLKGKM